MAIINCLLVVAHFEYLSVSLSLSKAVCSVILIRFRQAQPR